MVHFIDASNLILGKLAAKAAKWALSGDEVVIVNCEKAVISGKLHVVLGKFKDRESKTTPFKGPYRKRMPDRMVRSAVRGMLPHGRWSEGSRGRVALDKVMCYRGIPTQYLTQKFETFPDISSNTLKTPFYVTVGEIANLLKQQHGG